MVGAVERALVNERKLVVMLHVPQADRLADPEIQRGVALPGYPASAFRVSGEDILAGYMAWEIVTAIRWTAELTGINSTERDGIFCDNGMRLLRTVRLVKR
jgi:hypothetical protein